MTAAEAVRPSSRVPPESPDDAPEPFTQEQFASLAANYPDLRLERTKEGRLLIMPPAGGESSRLNFKIDVKLGIWSEQDDTGECFDSSAGFTLPNGADRSPDVAWVERSRWDALTPEQKKKFLPLCPDFLVEMLSPTDSLSETREKMQEYLDNGARLGWLINPRRKQVEVYRPGQEVEVLDNPTILSGEAVLPGFTLNLMEIFS